jgi:hypothetical protein
MKTSGRGFIPKFKFDTQEDGLLLEAVSKYGTADWNLIAGAIPGRNARQCRERWNNYVNPDLTKQEWTEAEDELLMRKCRELGRKWYIIAGFFQGRAKNSIRNRYFTLQRKQNDPSEGIPVHEEPIKKIESERKPESKPDVVQIRTESGVDPFAFLDKMIDSAAISWSSGMDDAESYFQAF